MIEAMLMSGGGMGVKNVQHIHIDSRGEDVVPINPVEITKAIVIGSTATTSTQTNARSSFCRFSIESSSEVRAENYPSGSSRREPVSFFVVEFDGNISVTQNLGDFSLSSFGASEEIISVDEFDPSKSMIVLSHFVLGTPSSNDINDLSMIYEVVSPTQIKLKSFGNTNTLRYNIQIARF